jgi:protein-S-isoprenylcysteine O-methyltransferase Ste14
MIMTSLFITSPAVAVALVWFCLASKANRTRKVAAVLFLADLAFLAICEHYYPLASLPRWASILYFSLFVFSIALALIGWRKDRTAKLVVEHSQS